MTTDLDFRWVDSDDALEAEIDTLIAEPRYAIDTEFHREKTYFPALALVQLGWPGNIILIDPLALDITRLRRLFESDSEAIFHAAQQDLDVLTHAVGAIPNDFFDTQIAANFVGYSTPSLVSLLSGELDLSVPKGDRLTDWLRRPLSDTQQQYAAADVAYLLELTDRLTAKLERMGRVEWVTEACEELARRPVSGTAPLDAWSRLKDARSLRGRSRAVAQHVAAWREEEAMRRDMPVRQVLPDLAILGIAQRKPRNGKELRQARGVDDRVNRTGYQSAILEAVSRAEESNPPEKPVGGDDLHRDLRPAVTLISAWISDVARREQIDTAMLATRADLIALLSERPDARLASGWRNEILGSDIQRLLAGEAALSFDSEQGLRLVSL